jgi:hypothetical protein
MAKMVFACLQGFGRPAQRIPPTTCTVLSVREGALLDKPVYFRPPEYLYAVRADPPNPRFTGRSAEGRQVLVIAETLLEFDSDGCLAGVQDCKAEDSPPAGFAECPIAVRRFWLEDRELGISDIPQGLLGLPRDPEQFTDANRAFVVSSEWFDWGNYALRCGPGQLFMSRDGECLLHSLD